MNRWIVDTRYGNQATDAWTSLLVSVALAVSSFHCVAAAPIFSDNFNYPDGLIVNEFSYWNPSDPRGIHSPYWEMDSGSLFAVDGAAWTGVPDDVSPNPTSSNGNDSCVFRLNTKRADFTNVAVLLSVLNRGLSSTARTPPVAWDGLHIWLRYQSESNLYYASINRRDNTVVIKKKVPGGPSNNGTYYELSAYVPYTVPYHTWQQAMVTVQDDPTGSVTIKTFINNRLVVSGTDNGVGGAPPITGGGKVGIRGDNADLKFENFAVITLPPTNLPTAITNLTATPLDQSSVMLEWPTFTDGPRQFFKVQVFSVSPRAFFLALPLSDLHFAPGGKLRARVTGLNTNVTYNAFLYRSKDLAAWSLASPVVATMTSP